MVLLTMASIVAEGSPKKIIAFGDSLTAGYGLNADSSYPAQLQKILDQNKIDARVINAGVSGDTTTAGLNRLDWVLSQGADIVILCLGANDAFQGISPKVTESNLDSMVKKILSRKSKVILGGMKAPPNLGATSKAYESIFPSIAKKYKITFIPFFLENVATQRTLNLGDGIHPNSDGYKIVADQVWKYLKPIL